jgi:hypothetical protein
MSESLASSGWPRGGGPPRGGHAVPSQVSAGPADRRAETGMVRC